VPLHDYTGNVRPCLFDLSVCVTWSGAKKTFGQHKKEGKVDVNSRHGFTVFKWAVQVAVRLVNAWQTP
jgi:hypothetical protein